MMPAATKKPLPWYYAVNDRPVKIVELPDGRMETLVFDWTTGVFVPDDSYFTRVFEPGKDVDQFTKEDFELKVSLLRVPIADSLCTSPVAWEHTGDGELPYRAAIGERILTVRVNDFPAEPLYTLLVDGQEIVNLDDWPSAWVRPPTPQALLDLVSKKKP